MDINEEENAKAKAKINAELELREESQENTYACMRKMSCYFEKNKIFP